MLPGCAVLRTQDFAMEPWQGGWAPWCVGSVFAAPQLLTAASSLPCKNIEGSMS